MRKIKPEMLRAITGSWSQEADDRLTIEDVVGHLDKASVMAVGEQTTRGAPLVDSNSIPPISKKISAQSSPKSQGPAMSQI